MYDKENIGGVVLAGGLASRMGFDKAKIRKQADLGARNILEHNVHLLQTFCREVWVSCRADALREGFTCVPDIYAQRGPAGALHASLLHAQARGLKAILVLACDMPAVSVASLEVLCKARMAASHDFSSLHIVPHAQPPLMTAYWQPERNFVQSLLALYEVAALPYFQEAVEEDKVKLRWIIPEAAQRRIVHTSQDCEQYDIFFNLNTPKDIQTWRKALR